MIPSVDAAGAEPPVQAPFWRLEETFAAGHIKWKYQGGGDRLSISIVNIEEAHHLLRALKVNEGMGRFKLLPIPPDQLIPIELRISAPDYAPDYFFETGFSFVSARFREAADLPLDKVQYLDAPCVTCAPAAKAKDYKAMWVHHFEDVLDPERTIIREPSPTSEPSRCVYREGYRSVSPIFQLGVFAGIMVDDALARRLVAAGLDGVAFEDITRPDLSWGRGHMVPEGK